MIARPLTEKEEAPELREALRVYPFACRCGCTHFTLDWAMYTDLTGEPRIWCASCGAHVVPSEPMEHRC